MNKKLIISIIFGMFIFLSLLLVGAYFENRDIYCAKNWTEYSPQKRINNNEISYLYNQEKIGINNKNYVISNGLGTGSMKPFMNGNNLILMPYENQNLEIGDIIVYSKNNKQIIHSICNVLEDEKGIYYVTKGFNNDYDDNLKIRDDIIRYILIGVIF